MPQAALRELLALGKLDGEAQITGADPVLRTHARRARRRRPEDHGGEGGSWLVRVALARTGKWIVDRGSVDAASATAQEPAGQVMETQSPAGLISHLKPVVQLSETPARWARPPVPLGHHRPEWP